MPERVLHAPIVGRPPGRRAWLRPALLVALLLSLLTHLALTLLPKAPPAPSRDDAPLKATIDTLPPPALPPEPVVAAPAEPARAAAKARPRPRPAPRPRAPVIAESTRDLAPIEIGPSADAGSQSPPPSQGAGGPPIAAAPAPLVEDVAMPGAAAVQAKTLPPRIDLAYKVFVGTRGFEIGDATYRFEHANRRYRIFTVGQARGLASLLMRGQGRLESTGMITPEGLQPLQFTVERFNRRGREKAQFDWEAGVVALEDDKTAPLDVPTFDPLTLMWQYFFTPPTADRLSFSIATTRRVARYTVSREGTERLELPGRSIDAERWVRVAENGSIEAYAWLAPELRYIPVKMRITDPLRGTIEAVLDAIRVDETGETVGRDDLPLLPSPVLPALNAASPESMPGYSPPGATFPSMTP